MAATEKKPIDSTTEGKILEAARKVFTRKGYAATRTRDIAEEAGINLALLNYYFRSKEKLFDIVMMENIQHLFGGIREIINDRTTSLKTKLELLAENYINLLSSNPDLPMFVLGEIRQDPARFAVKMAIADSLKNSSLFRQMEELDMKGPETWQLIINFMSMVLFPFIGKPLLQEVGGFGQNEYKRMMEERKKLIPVWIEEMIRAGSKVNAMNHSKE